MIARSNESPAGGTCGEISVVTLPPVLFVLPQSDASANGGLASISHIISGLRHHRAIIVTDRESARVKEWRLSGIETHVLPQTVSASFLRNPLGTVRSYWRYARELRRLIASSGAKVLHANSPLALQLSVAAAKFTGTKLVLNLRGTFSAAGRLPSRPKYRLVFAAADHVLYLSHDMARRWRNHVANATSSYSVTYSAVDPARFRPTPPSEQQPVVLVSALMRPLKGQLEFIRHVAPRLAENGIKLWFAGDPDVRQNQYMAECARAAAPLDDTVEFLGYRTDVPELIARASVIAIPSHHEGLVRAMIEGMSCGRPVVSFDVCSAREMLEEQSGGAGVVVDHGDYGAMADAIVRYCSDPDLAARSGEKGVATAARLFAPDAVVSRYEDLYQVLESGGKANFRKWSSND